MMIITIIPVSYTHLDVYKRQVLEGQRRLRISMRRAHPYADGVVGSKYSADRPPADDLLSYRNNQCYLWARPSHSFIIQYYIIHSFIQYYITKSYYCSLNRIKKSLLAIHPVSYTHLDVYKRQLLDTEYTRNY